MTAARIDPATKWLNSVPADRIDFNGELGATISLAMESGRVTHILLEAKPKETNQAS